MWRPSGHSCSLVSSHFGTQRLRNFLKPVTSHLHQVIPFSLSLFLLHAGHLEGSHRDWLGRGRGHDTCLRRQSPHSWFPAADHTSRPDAAGFGREGHTAMRDITTGGGCGLK